MKELEDEALLMALLNSAPVQGGEVADGLVGDAGAALAAAWGGSGSPVELSALREVRGALHEAIRGGAGAAPRGLDRLVGRAALRARLDGGELVWELDAPPDELLAVRALLAWSQAQKQMPGRLRACANAECNLFLLDHSRPGNAKWCSMATCGNRMKARSHARAAAASKKT